MRYARHCARDPGQVRAGKCVARFIAQAVLFPLQCFAFAYPLAAQDVGSEEKEFQGQGAVITVKLHEVSGPSFSSAAVVKLLRGVFPSRQKDASRGVAEFVVTSLGEFTVVVSAPGYAEVQKDVSIVTNGRTQVDVYLRPTAPTGTISSVRGRPVLAPKAKQALDKGLHALKENKVGEAEKYVDEALRLAPGNPDVLYVQGVLSLKQRNWEQARTALEKATQMDPNSARAFAALGMAFCDEGNYDEAVSALEKSMQLDPPGTWETRWALAQSYYHRQQYEEALRMSREGLAQSSTAVGRYEEAAQTLREFLKDHGDRPECATARRWLEQLTASGEIRPN